MRKRIRSKILDSILKPIANTEGKLEDKADYIFECLIKNKIVSEEEKSCFITELFKHISQISDDMSNAFDKAVKKALVRLNISIEEGTDDDKNKRV